LRKILVLVVDDEPVIVRTLVTIFNQQAEFIGVGETSIESAMILIRALCFDIVLLDVVMPGVEGLEHAITIRDECKTSVLLFSGESATSDHLARARQQGVAAFEILAKPIHPVELIDKVKAIASRGESAADRRPSQTITAS